MDVPYYTCEDCGAAFTRTELLPDVEEDLLSCPECGGLDIGLVEEEPAALRRRVRRRRPETPVRRRVQAPASAGGSPGSGASPPLARW